MSHSGAGEIAVLRKHWPEYLMEAAGLGLFMVSACLFGTLLSYGGSPVVSALPDPTQRRLLMGAAMGLTSIALVYSPWGRRSGGHYNPAFTLAFLRLGKVDPRDAFWYVGFQFLGSAAGVMLAAMLLGRLIADPAVNYVVTVPGPSGKVLAFGAEVLISGLLMGVVLVFTNRERLAPYTGLIAGLLVAAYISLEAPISGMSMNPARTFGSAFAAHLWTAFWIYLTAPLLGMLLASELYVRGLGRRVFCAKLQHDPARRCIFCEYRQTASS